MSSPQSAEDLRRFQEQQVRNESPLGQLLRFIGLRNGMLVNLNLTTNPVSRTNLIRQIRNIQESINALERQLGRKVTVFDQLAEPVTKLTESMRDEGQFFSAPTTTFDIIGVQGEQPSTISRGAGEFQQFLLQQTQPTKPQVSDSFKSIHGEVTYIVNSGISTRIFGTGGVNYSMRVLVHDLSGNNQTDRRISFKIGPPNFVASRAYTVSIPTGSTRARIEIQAFTTDGKPVSNVFNETHIGDSPPPPPPPTKTCQCIDPRTGLVTVTSGHPFNEPCPVCKLPPKPPPIGTKFCECTQRFIPLNQVCPTCPLPPPPPTTDFSPNIFDKGIVALLAVAALLPRGKKK